MVDQVRSTVWADAGNGTTIHRIRTDVGAATIQADMVAISHADWITFWEGDIHINGSPSPSVGQYQAANQSAFLSFLCADATIVVLQVPAPKLSIFLSDGVTVDATTITTLIADCIGHLESTTGSKAASFLGGHLGTKF